MERFHDLLFEVSNENRYDILLLLKEKPRRITDFSKQMGLTTTETSRHVNRLGEFGLLQKNPDGSYSITYFGELTLLLLEEFKFASRNIQYLVKHDTTKLPTQYVKRLGELSECEYVDNVIRFLRYIEDIIVGSEKLVYLQVDQYPLTTLNSIIEALDRGVNIRIIEKREIESGPHIDLESTQESQHVIRTRQSPLVRYKTLNEIDVFLILSENRCAVAFPTQDRRFDYMGFTATDERSLRWCGDLFQHYWARADQRKLISPIEEIRRTPELMPLEESFRRILIEGKNDPKNDAQTVQDAVDNYEEVILKGTFNFADTAVQINRSVIIKGEGRERNIPSATMYKTDWTFPFTEPQSFFRVNGEGIDVTIENLNFTDFNCACIWAENGNSLTIKDNRITLLTGYGRGLRYASFGDVVMGMFIDHPIGSEEGGFSGGIVIDGNYLDFARRGGGAEAGYLLGAIERDPEYRPDLFNHEYYIGVGISVSNASGKVIIENNIVRNMSGRGISTMDNLDTADVHIRHNVVESNLFGSYPFHSAEAGIGIIAQSGFSYTRKGANIEIKYNTIKLDELNYCGIGIFGPLIDRDGVGKFGKGLVRNNQIYLKEGRIGILVRKSDNIEVADNSISGSAYYGIQISGRRTSGELDLRASDNIVEKNNLRGLEIRLPDKYSDNHADGRVFASSKDKSATAHVWLNAFSKDNVIKVRADETVIDEGKDTKITYIDNE